MNYQEENPYSEKPKIEISPAQVALILAAVGFFIWLVWVVFKSSTSAITEEFGSSKIPAEELAAMLNT